jgi:hypothetical protein
MPTADLGRRADHQGGTCPGGQAAHLAMMTHGLAGWRIVDRAYRVPLKKS